MKDENDKILLYLNRKLKINGSIDTQLLLSTIEFIIVPFMLEHTLCVFPGYVFNTMGFSDKLLNVTKEFTVNKLIPSKIAINK